MIIVSQDKTKIINFENLIEIYITQDEMYLYQDDEEKYYLRREAVGGIYENLGKYDTEERAKEVLQEIIKAYKETNYEYEACWCLRNIVYEMPEK